jgi:hypothetical protein
MSTKKMIFDVDMVTGHVSFIQSGGMEHSVGKIMVDDFAEYVEPELTETELEILAPGAQVIQLLREGVKPDEIIQLKNNGLL